jgi:hypothetical protein
VSGSLYVLLPIIIAFLVIGALVAILRWSSDSDMTRKQAEIFGARADIVGEPVQDLREPADYGLLAVVAVVDTPADARAAQDRLADAGIRATVASAEDGRINLLVFDSEKAAARRVVGGSPI